MSKEIRAIVRAFEAEGFDVVTKPGNNHPKVYRDGHLVTTLPSSPSDWRSLKNAQATLRRLSRAAK